jgi:altronate dehydratase small subunit
MARAIVLDPTDNVATLFEPGRAGEACTLQGEGNGRVTLLQDVPFGHKVCVTDTPPGAAILKYGQIIGTARVGLKAGEHAHVHNIDSARARGDLARS